MTEHEHNLVPVYTAHGHTYGVEKQWFIVEFCCDVPDCEYSEIEVTEAGEA